MSDTTTQERRHDMTVPEMARDAAVSQDKVRTWCRAGLIPGAWNIGDSDREFWRVPQEQWEKFKTERQADIRVRAAETVTRSRTRPNRNLLGL